MVKEKGIKDRNRTAMNISFIRRPWKNHRIAHRVKLSDKENDMNSTLFVLITSFCKREKGVEHQY